MTDMTRREFGVTALGGLAAARPGQREAGTGAGADAARPYRYVHLDVFTDRRLAGNQLLVYTSPTGLDTESMQGLTRESNYSENTFVFPPEQAGTDFRVRIFTRTAETPFAGHPTIGTAFALAHTGALRPGTARTMFQLGVGPTPLDLEWKDGRLAFAWMTQQKPNFGKTIADRAALAAALGLEPQYVDPRAPAQEVYSGSTFFIVPLATRKAVDGAVLDRTKIDALFTAAGIQRRGIYVFSIEPGSDSATAYSRMLPAGGIEDPATGSAVGPAGLFMAKHGYVPAARAGSIVVLQGVFARRPSMLHVRVEMSGGEVSGVKVGGTSVVVGEGTMAV
ncbi:MAG TPA: PhzF family phenazine biosynthesis protein [Vicinamibacterales bacterium]|nr:PhzF family phenazine biosynthesis protein [Vicinamibacterales bacterium]